LKILHVNYSESSGGAAIAANRLHKALLKNDINSKMLVIEKNSDDPTVIGPNTKLSKYSPKFRNLISQKILARQKTGNPVLHSLNFFSTGLHEFINLMNIDIVHLHWINSEMLSIKEIAKINKPIIWTLHDSWAFCGAEHHPAIENDSRYIDEYTKNTRNLGDSGIDLNSWIWKIKNKYWKKVPMSIVCPSKWLYKNCKNSYLFKKKNIYNIPNCISTDDFSPLDKSLSRELLNLPVNKKYILFGAANATSHPLKGYGLLTKALRTLNNSSDVELLVFGSSDPGIDQQLNIKTRMLGHLHDDQSLKLLYNAADVFVSPSMQENLSNVIMESLACATPVVAFDIGGNSDMIKHKVNGYLAKPFETADLANGIEWILDHSEYNQLSASARKKVEEKFSEKIIVEKYTRLYKQIL